MYFNMMTKAVLSRPVMDLDTWTGGCTVRSFFWTDIVFSHKIGYTLGEKEQVIRMRTFDYTKLKERTWDSAVLGYVAQIHEYKGRQQFYLKQQPAGLDRLVELAKIQSTEASNEIEGIRTTSTRLRQLCAEKTTPRNRNEWEIMGYRDVLSTIHENYEYIPVRSNYILQLHRDLYRYSEKGIGGCFKNIQNYITEENAHVR